MKKLILLLSIIIFIQVHLYSQDIIITKKNDTISCSITKINRGRLYYRSYISHNFLYKSIDTAQIRKTIKNYYLQTIDDKELLAELHPDVIVTVNFDTVFCDIIRSVDNFLVYSEQVNDKKVFKSINKLEVLKTNSKPRYRNRGGSHFEINLNAGYAARLANKPGNLPSEARKLYNDLENGLYIGVTAAYLFNDGWGVGAKYSHFRASGNGKLPFEMEDGELVNIETNLKVSINFIGARAFWYFLSKDQKYRLGLIISLGPVFYDEEGDVGGIFTSSKGSAFSTGIGMDFVYYFSSNIGISLNTDIHGGTINKYDFKFGEYSERISLESEDKISISHLQLGIGLVVKI